MSVHSIRHNFRIIHLIEDLLGCLAGRWLVSWIRVSLPLRSKIKQGSFQSQPLWRLNGSICLTTLISQKLSVLLKGGVAMGGVVALEVAHVVEVVVDVVERVEEA